MKEKVVTVCMKRVARGINYGNGPQISCDGYEYKGEHGGDHSKEYYEKNYGKYEHEKNHMKEEGSSMKDKAMKI
jgi:hypothetical protein